MLSHREALADDLALERGFGLQRHELLGVVLRQPRLPLLVDHEHELDVARRRDIAQGRHDAKTLPIPLSEERLPV